MGSPAGQRGTVGCVRYDSRAWRIAVAELTGVAARFTAGYGGQQPDDAAAVAEMRSITRDPHVLADAAAYLQRSDQWYRDAAVELLIAAGTTRELVDEYARRQGKRRPGFDLGQFAEQA